MSAPSKTAAAEESTPAPGSTRDEYLDASANARHFQTLRFAQLTVFFAVTGALLATSFTTAAAPSSQLGAISLKIGGLVVTALFLVLQERTMAYWRHFVRRAAELEAGLGYRQYSGRPAEPLITGHRAMELLFVGVGVFWALTLVLPASS